MSNSQIVEPPEKNRVWKTQKKHEIKNRVCEKKQIRQICHVFHGVAHVFLAPDSHKDLTDHWQHHSLETRKRDMIIWLDTRKPWRLETKHQNTMFSPKTKHNDEWWCFAHEQTKHSLWAQQWLVSSLWQKVWMKCRSSLTLNSSSPAVLLDVDAESMPPF